MPYTSAVVKDNKKCKTVCMNVMSIVTSVQKTTFRSRLNFTFKYNSYHVKCLIRDQFPQVASPVPSWHAGFDEMSLHYVKIRMKCNSFPYFVGPRRHSG